jgi:aryl-alcohol dehydrogenase-like predicted oxidoreductase
MSQRLALGTVQFGLPYGIANATGQVARDDAAAILRDASSAGVDMLDTAIGYGDSERRLGEIGVAGWRIVSKLSGIPESCVDVESWAHDSVDGTLARLRVSALHGLLLHRSLELCGPRGDELRRALESVRASGKVAKIGVSVYGPDELDALAGMGPFDLVQAPFNVFDRRMQTSGWLARLSSGGTEIHTRSAFLQGLMLMPESERPARFRRWQPLWTAWSQWLAAEGATPLEACLRFVLSEPLIDRVIVGVDRVGQLREILGTLDRPALVPPTSLASDDPDLINPARWSSN